MNKLISVIIPCYNVDKYVAKCLESVLQQTFRELEVIVVNDGSTDGTTDIIKDYRSDNRVRYIEQANAGVSAARNAGIDAASGELLAFVDSDDYLEPQMYERLYAAMQREGADMAVCNYNLVYDDHTDRQYSKIPNETVEVYCDIYGYFARFCACPKPNNYIWTRLYKMELVRKSGVRFEKYKLGDDTLFNFKLLPYIHRVTFVEDGLYNYFQRSNSNVYTVANKSNLATVYADTFGALAEYYNSKGFTEFLDVLPIHAFTRLRSVFFYSRLAGMSEDDITASIMLGFKDREIAKYLTGSAL
jgi:glycosyltransferase involved in cell wall biosynthesis